MEKEIDKREFLKTQSHEQLEDLVIKGDKIILELRHRLYLITGCGNFGNPDWLSGHCTNCRCENPNMCNRCKAFQSAVEADKPDK